MTTQTVSQLEAEMAKLQEELARKQKALEEQKEIEIAEIKAKREQGIRTAWDKVTKELVKADMVNALDLGDKSDRGKKIAETSFNKKCYDKLGQVLGMVPIEEPKKRRGLNDDQKAKIEQWAKEGLTVAEMNKKIYTDPSQKSYQRVNNYVKKLKE